MQASIDKARLFYTTRPESRSSPGGQRGDKAILPPFASLAFAAALASLDVETVFVPRGEADGQCVVIAAEMGGYVLGLDSDFVILGSAADMKGYIPFDMVEWIEPTTTHEAVGDGFTTTSAKKVRVRSVSRLLPRSSGATLILPIYTSEALARRLRLPLNMLPLLAALLGNDYTSSSDTNYTLDRVDRVARTLRETVARPGSHNADTAYELVSRVVRKLHAQAYVDERKLAEKVDGAIDATIQYVLPSPQCCSLYPFCSRLSEGCTTRAWRLPTALRSEASASVVEAYAAARATGHLDIMTRAWLHPGRVYLRDALENPAGPSARAGRISINARRATYAIVDAALGMRWPAKGAQNDEALERTETAQLMAGLSLQPSADDADTVENGEKSQDEAETVGNGEKPQSEAGTVEDKSALDDAEDGTQEAAVRRVVTEYLRQGSSARVGSQQIELPAPGDSTSLLAPLDERLAAFRDALDAPASVSSLPVDAQPLACALRMCILSAAETDPGGHQGRRWRRSEVEAVVRAALGCMKGWDDDLDDDVDAEELYPLLETRNAELVAQLSAALLDTLTLAQALLLTDGAHITPYVYVSGTALHSLLSGAEPPAACGWRRSRAWEQELEDIVAAVLDGAEEALGVAHAPKKKKKKQRAEAPAPAKGGRFDMLLDEMI
ncbi:hypothetical protein CC85DRAFT_285804 [Cutaneotrichosporon oleaginosum]|uniref:Asteroid domain-containing protein n=1 Tax=Cutaneotrichosporon oleaginosum TaxID=879819 RepID=A0A0J1B3J2_9TREE|nr:uncharacterized protein CC85DRAFT_285804 [Cutaneotrichosporon oleaginosum]KLT42219.1 hypothetical protein CC85DRAFT_285804 [Cutaneotrichosporon oleaginosum]TXT11662.1 hypothetical protein COLE_02072 [Cutaneotrichosporon oleaginosum]